MPKEKRIRRAPERYNPGDERRWFQNDLDRMRRQRRQNKEAQKKEQELEKQVLLNIIRRKREEEENNEDAKIKTTENELTVVLSVPGVSQKMKLTYIVDSAYSSQENHEIAKNAILN
jgi:hypothetical protein